MIREHGLAEVGQMFFDALHAPGPMASPAQGMTLYDALLGDWTLEVIDHGADGTQRRSKGEAHFAWVLEGRAIQDVWIVPSRDARRLDAPVVGNRYGTTLRVYDAKADVWNVTWINPVSGAMNRLVARGDGRRIFQHGTDPDGSWIRWIFSDVTGESFHWRGERSRDGGLTWRLEAEFLGRRVCPKA